MRLEALGKEFSWGQGRIQAVWETGIPVWAPKFWRPKKHFSSLVFLVVFQQKICGSSDQLFHNGPNYF